MMYFIKYPILDLIIALVWFWGVSSPWKNPSAPDGIDSLEERSLGAAVIMGQLSSIITGASIIIAGIAAFVALGKVTLDPSQKYHLLMAAIWSVSALGLSLYTMSMLPTRTFKYNFTNSSLIAKFSAMALFFALAGGVRLVLAIYSFLFA